MFWSRYHIMVSKLDTAGKGGATFSLSLKNDETSKLVSVCGGVVSWSNVFFCKSLLFPGQVCFRDSSSSCQAICRTERLLQNWRSYIISTNGSQKQHDLLAPWPGTIWKHPKDFTTILSWQRQGEDPVEALGKPFQSFAARFFLQIQFFDLREIS